MPKTLGEKGHEVYRVLADWLIGHPNQPFRVKEIGGDTYALSTKTHAWAQHTFTRLSGRTITSELSKYYEEVMHAHGGGLLFNTVPPDWKPGKNLDGCYVWDTAARVVDGAIVDNEFDVVHEHKVLQRARVWLPTTNGAARLVKPTEVPAVPAEPAPAVSSLPVKVAAHAPTEALSGPVTLMAAGDKRVILRVGGDVLVCRIEHQLSAMLEVN